MCIINMYYKTGNFTFGCPVFQERPNLDARLQNPDIYSDFNDYFVIHDTFPTRT